MCNTDGQWKAEGYTYDPATRAWTQRVEYEARTEMEAIRWCNFNRNWFTRLRHWKVDAQ